MIAVRWYPHLWLLYALLFLLEAPVATIPTPR
jgi:hypothetical protein